MSYREPIAAILPELVELRHELHKHPELAYQEQRTAELIRNRLSQIEGLSIRTGLAKTGIVATLNADRPGRCVALRADMDALPITETNEVEYRSACDGVMHACGHDGHMTCLLGAARILAAGRDELPGKVKFIFQPAEENGAGGRLMVEQGALDDPKAEAAFAMHGWPELEAGKIIVGAGPVLAAATAFSVQLTGRSSHAAYPHQGRDIIVAAAHLVTKLQTIAARFADPVDPVVVSICAVQAGDTYNVLPATCRLLGTIRALRQETHDAVIARLERFISSAASDFDATADIAYLDSYPTLVNDPGAAGLVQRVASRLAGADNVIDAPPPTMGGEDFAFFARAVPAAFWRLGLRPAGVDSFPKLHQPDFDFPDEAIPAGVEMHCEIARAFLETGL